MLKTFILTEDKYQCKQVLCFPSVMETAEHDTKPASFHFTVAHTPINVQTLLLSYNHVKIMLWITSLKVCASYGTKSRRGSDNSIIHLWPPISATSGTGFNSRKCFFLDRCILMGVPDASNILIKPSWIWRGKLFY